MSLDKENMKKICLLIVFTLAVFVGLWRLEAVIAAISFLGGILAPFILGGAIAFILSVPMNRIEITICKLCSKDSNEKRQRKREKFLRPFSMILTLVFVIAVLALAFIVLFLVLQQLEGNLIYPHVVGGSVGLPSIWVLVAVTVGGSLMGIVGMLIFIPLMSVLYTLLRQDVVKRLEKKQLDIS